MKADPRFLNQSKRFWAHVRQISQMLGYTQRVYRAPSAIRTYTIEEIATCIRRLGLNDDSVVSASGIATPMGSLLVEYFEHRAEAINNVVKSNLMDAEEAESLYQSLLQNYSPEYPVPLNKQKGDKAGVAKLTAMVNLLVERELKGREVNLNPMKLASFSYEHRLERTFARRVDGAFPDVVNPIAIWEIKEYYHTTTFGSRIADGVYEVILDGMEIENLKNEFGVAPLHYLFIDSRRTYWAMGKSFLCRLIDTLHMGYISELVVGKELVTAVPAMVIQWIDILEDRDTTELST